MNYFDDLLGAAHTLVKEAAGITETTKNFKTALEVAKTVLERDYTPEDIAENLGDVDFANEFAQELFKVMNDLKSESQAVSDEMQERKSTLDNTLTGFNKYFGEEEEELVELGSMADLGTQFNKLNDACSTYFNDVSKFVYDLQMGYIKTVVTQVYQRGKNILILADKTDFTEMKVHLFDVLDAAKDVQLKVESAQYRLANNSGKINRYISKRPVWAYQHKYASKSINQCEEDRAIVQGELKKFHDLYV